MYQADDVMDCTWLSATCEGEDTYLLGNGVAFVEVPSVAITAIKMTRGRSLGAAREALLRETGADIDIVDFVNTLSESGVLERQGPDPNLWDRIQPARVQWIFSRWLALPYLFLVATAAVALAWVPSSRPRYGNLAWSGNTAAALATFFVATWLLVFLHELCHIVAARSLGIQARLSLGTRMQFLVAQTDVSGVWAVERNRRYRVYLAGLVADIALAAVFVCLAAWVWPTGAPSRLVGALLIIKLSQIAWQFLVFTRTDLYYTIANLVGSRNLLADADTYLHSRLPRRGSGEATPPVADVSRAVRIYAYVLILGRLAALAFFCLYTVPVTVTFCREAIPELSTWPSLSSLNGFVTLAVLAFGWMMFAVTFLRQYARRRTLAPAAGNA
jgi:hypothetical protein